jgi:F-type H+-transporting ATPase subunit delta
MKQPSSAKVSLIVEGILNYLNRADAMTLLPEVAEQLQQRTARKNHSATVETTTEPDEKMKLRFKDLLMKKYKWDGETQYILNPDLIGGVKITLGDKVLDLSVKNKLQKIYEQI